MNILKLSKKNLSEGLIAAVTASLFVLSLSASATERMYGVIGASYGQADYQDVSSDGEGYKLAIGYQVDPQWYVEAGYYRLANDSVDPNQTVANEELLAGDALGFSVLGKAGSKDGELFYRLGVLRADMEGFAMTDASFSYVDKSAYAGTVGLGFDWFVGLNSMVRFEVEHIFGQDDLKVSIATIGFRYNFN